MKNILVMKLWFFFVFFLMTLCIAGPNRGIPHQLAVQNDRASRISNNCLPSTDTAVSLFEATGGRLGQATIFGRDPLAGHSELIEERRSMMETNIPSPEELFGWTVNDSIQQFSSSIEYMVEITQDLQRRYV